ncbi:MAG: cytochrome c oxidase assembly factor Coa1 family protein [Myxococcaceae bacterium]
MRPNPTPMSPDGQPPMQQQSWFGRNWKWLVPVGCGVPMICCLSFAAMTYFGASKLIEGSAPFVEAISKATGNDEVKATLGTPLKAGMGLNGSFNEKNGNGTADFSVPISGPKGSGTLRVKGTSLGGVWVYDVMQVEAGGKVIDLLENDAPPPPKKGGKSKGDDLPPPDDTGEEPADPDGD